MTIWTPLISVIAPQHKGINVSWCHPKQRPCLGQVQSYCVPIMLYRLPHTRFHNIYLVIQPPKIKVLTFRILRTTKLENLRKEMEPHPTNHPIFGLIFLEPYSFCTMQSLMLIESSQMYKECCLMYTWQQQPTVIPMVSESLISLL